MRLQQVRDWLAGQPFADLAQHRLGLPPGVEMHWSRIGDLGPAAIIVMLEPLLGRHGVQVLGDVGQVVAWAGNRRGGALDLLTRRLHVRVNPRRLASRSRATATRTRPGIS